MKVLIEDRIPGTPAERERGARPLRTTFLFDALSETPTPALLPVLPTGGAPRALSGNYASLESERLALPPPEEDLEEPAPGLARSR